MRRKSLPATGACRTAVSVKVRPRVQETTGRTRTATYKRDWSTTVTRTGLQATSWVVTTSGAMDHEVTGAACGP